jgi:hypothetical protein
MELIGGRRLLSAGAFAFGLAVVLTACTSSTTSSSLVAPSSNKCSVAVSNSPSSFAAAGGSGSATISASRDCTWSVTADSSWVSITGASQGQGEAVVPFSVAANPVPSARSASITVGSQRAALSQAAAPCTFSLSRTRDAVAAVGGALSVGVATLTGCSWSASTSAPWLTIVAGQSGSASGTVGLSVAPNSGAARVATMNVAGQTYTVNQDAAGGAPAPAPAPSPAPAPAPAPAPPPPPGPVDIDGTVLLVWNRCPTVSFLVDLTTVTTDGKTDFKGGHCPDLSIGDNVQVTGQPQSDGTVLADHVTFKKEHNHD